MLILFVNMFATVESARLYFTRLFYMVRCVWVKYVSNSISEPNRLYKPFQQPPEANTRRTWMLFALWTKGWGWEVAFWMSWPWPHLSRRVHAPRKGQIDQVNDEYYGKCTGIFVNMFLEFLTILAVTDVVVPNIVLGRGTEHMPMWHRMGNRDQSIQSALDYLFQQDWVEMLVELGWAAYTCREHIGDL